MGNLYSWLFLEKGLRVGAVTGWAVVLCTQLHLREEFVNYGKLTVGFLRELPSLGTGNT